MKLLLILISISVFLGIYSQNYAQDGHYWSENYGNRSMLLSGTVNASVEDLGAVFYNPGRLGLIENPAFVISAKVYEWSTIRIKDGLDEGVDLNQSSFGGAPSLVAGTFSVPFLKDHKFA
ncbi:MAG: long-chain fatty acid transport protein, partial [Cyclobacteriaceae bacterium]|nr:long-chain fatty acid transport protein [Cyclobacteriaceae bacterium]